MLNRKFKVVAGADLKDGQWCARFGDRTEDPVGGLTVADLKRDLKAGVDVDRYQWEHFNADFHARSVVAYTVADEDAPAPMGPRCNCDSCVVRFGGDDE
jgi:hypothetical protein